MISLTMTETLQLQKVYLHYILGTMTFHLDQKMTSNYLLFIPTFLMSIMKVE